MEKTIRWEAVFKVNGVEWGSYVQGQDEALDDFKDEVFLIEAEITREAYRELRSPNVTVEMVEI